MKFASSMLKTRTAFQQRNFATLVLSEHFEGKLSPSLGSLLTAAKELNDD